MIRLAPAALSALFLLSGCSAISSAIEDPQLSIIGAPADQHEAQIISLPMPEEAPRTTSKNSLWAPNKRSFFTDQRAQGVGDILTVLIEIDDEARLRNSTARSRDTSNELGIEGLFGLNEVLENAIGGDFSASQAVDLDSASRTLGAGEINRNEAISLRVAALITQQLPNGVYVIAGRQEVRVNSELRELRIAGLIRPQDITASNTIDYSKIAEARIAYGGRGTLSTVQKPRYGQRVYEVIMPF